MKRQQINQIYKVLEQSQQQCYKTNHENTTVTNTLSTLTTTNLTTRTTSTTKKEQFNYYQTKNTPATKIVLTFSLIQKESDPPRHRKTKQQQTNKQTKNCVLNKVAPAKQKRSPPG